MTSDYVVATPVWPYRTWTIPMFRRGIERQQTLPKAVGIVTSRDVFDEWFSDNPMYVFVGEHPDHLDDMLERIALSREMLRKWFSDEREETYVWWIDSDIELMEKDAFEKITRPIEEKMGLLVSNGYQARDGERGKKWHGIGCTIVHRDVANAGRFFVGDYITDDGETWNLSEDFVYFSSLEWGGWAILRGKPSYSGVRVAGSFTEVTHHTGERFHLPKELVQEKLRRRR